MLFGMIAPIFTWIVCFLIPGRKAAIAYVECKNKCRIMMLVQNLQSYMDPEGKTPLQTIVEKCYALGAFPSLWAIEGVSDGFVSKDELVECVGNARRVDAVYTKDFSELLGTQSVIITAGA